jgi:hypothetical protein
VTSPQQSAAFLRWCLLCLFATSGCGNNLGIVTGTVTLDGQPVVSGMVTFVKQDGNHLVRDGAVITDGKFQAKVPPGTYKLELNGQKVISKRTQKNFDGQDETLDVTGEMFPPQFNVQTKLTQEIKPGPNPVKLELNSKP